MNILDFLADQIKKNSLIEILLFRKDKIQEEFFDKDEVGTTTHLNRTLDEIFSLTLNQGPLYRRWSKEIDGKIRDLSIPKPPLRKLLENYVLPLVKTQQTHANCHGGEKNWSPERSLTTHLPIGSALSFDLKSAFEFFPISEIYRFYSDLVGNTFSHSNEIISFFTEVSTVPYGNHRGLPVGSLLSIALINRTLFNLDTQLDENAEEKGFRYSRWIDDITISSPSRSGIENFLGAVDLTNARYPVSPIKIFFQNSSQDIYLLGHKITPEGRVLKNTREERTLRKPPALNYELIKRMDYETWT